MKLAMLALVAITAGCSTKSTDDYIREAPYRKVPPNPTARVIDSGTRADVLAPCAASTRAICECGNINSCSSMRRLLDRDPELKEACANRHAIEGSFTVLAATPSLALLGKLPSCDKGKSVHMLDGKGLTCRGTEEITNQVNCNDVAQVGLFANRQNPRWPEVVRRLKDVCGLDPLPAEK